MIRRALLSALVVTGAVLGSFSVALVASVPAQAGPITRLEGAMGAVQQNSATHALIVKGYAYDPAHKSEPVKVSVRVNGRSIAYFTTNIVSSTINRQHHLSGAHAFHVTLHYSRKASAVLLVAHAARNQAQYQIVSRRAVVQTSPSTLVISEAKQFVGRAPYVWGGSSPRGFDCSGFAMYVYKQAGMRSLPHSAQGQRVSADMHRISRLHARAGDLVFDLSGGYAYHVAIYVGHGRAVAAIEAGRPVGYQIPPSDAVYGTDWH